MLHYSSSFSFKFSSFKVLFCNILSFFPQSIFFKDLKIGLPFDFCCINSQVLLYIIGMRQFSYTIIFRKVCDDFWKPLALVCTF